MNVTKINNNQHYLNIGKNLIKTKVYFKKYFDASRAVGETLDDETMAFRISNMEMMLVSGIPIAKLDSMRPFLERHGKQNMRHPHRT